MNKGRSLTTMGKFEVWIEDELDNLYSNPNLYNKFTQ